MMVVEHFDSLLYDAMGAEKLGLVLRSDFIHKGRK